MDIVLQYIVTLLPTVTALLAEVGVVKWALSTLAKAKETQEFKAVVDQNKVLVNELREAKKLNKELLIKIDRIQRGEE